MNFLVYFFFALKVSVTLSTISIYHSNDQLLSEAPNYERMKRATNETDPCVIKCLSEMEENVKKNFPHISEQRNDVETFINPEDIAPFCNNVFEPVSNCTSKCADSKFRFYVLASFSPMKYVCVDNFEGAKKVYPCTFKVVNGTKQKCQDPCLQKYNMSSDASTTNDTNPLITTICKRNKCIADCQLPLIKTSCGDSGVKFLKGIVKSAMDAEEKASENMTGEKIKWPKPCSEFLKILSE